ncbi:hypothetical protein [Actinomadura sp. CNU-125]|uniref:hypothetical protein n=1 Tax=Actinomadura sp. CNU-125 TaxID=1904961 RepID=UPI000A8F4EB8|nr:hypothetical protein [Actinomadura sp. CNU-125]
MSFGTYARRVRAGSLDPRDRHMALRCAVGRYRPLGFNATWAYVTAVARPLPDVRRDVPALVRALDVLEASRSVRLAEDAAFAAVRRAEKAAGRRTPYAPPTWPPSPDAVARPDGAVPGGARRGGGRPAAVVPPPALPGRVAAAGRAGARPRGPA